MCLGEEIFFWGTSQTGKHGKVTADKSQGEPSPESPLQSAAPALEASVNQNSNSSSSLSLGCPPSLWTSQLGLSLGLEKFKSLPTKPVWDFLHSPPC